MTQESIGKYGIRPERRVRTLWAPIIATLGVIGVGCSSPQTDASKVDAIPLELVSMSYVGPGGFVDVKAIDGSQTRAFNQIPKIKPKGSFSSKNEKAPDKVKLGLNIPVRVPAEFSSKASDGDGHGNTPDGACIYFKTPAGTKSIGVVSDIEKPNDFVIFKQITDGDDNDYRAQLCFDARSENNPGTIAIVASSNPAANS